MALFQEPLIDYSVPALRFTRGSEARVLVRAIVAQLSPHEYGLIITKDVEGGLSDNPPEVLSYALIDAGIDFDTLGRTRTVVFYPGQQHAIALRHSFSLTFDEEGEFWGFVFSLAQAKTTAVTRLSDLGDKFLKALTTVPTVRAASTGAEDRISVTVDVGVATEA